MSRYTDITNVSNHSNGCTSQSDINHVVELDLNLKLTIVEEVLIYFIFKAMSHSGLINTTARIAGGWVRDKVYITIYITISHIYTPTNYLPTYLPSYLPNYIDIKFEQ